jgi:glycosyltransferase involved in cell wall biosynthesis
MRYILFLNRLKSMAGGVERMVVNYANYLVAEDHNVVIITVEKREGEPFYALDNKVEYIGLGKILLDQKSAIYDSMSRIIKLRQFFRLQSPDYILAFQFGPYKIASISSLFLGQKVVMMERNSPQRYVYISEGPSIIRNLWLLFSYRIAVQFPEYGDYYPRYLRHKIITSRNFTHCRSELLPIKSFPDILFVGRYGFQKNTDLVYEVFSALAERQPSMNLYMIGENIECRYNSNYENLILSKPKGKWYELSRNSIVVLLSRFEGCPNVFLEAMSMGIPCFGLDGVDGIHNLLSENRGFLSGKKHATNIADDLFRYGQNLDLQNMHRLNAHDYVNRFHEKTSVVSGFIEELNA